MNSRNDEIDNEPNYNDNMPNIYTNTGGDEVPSDITIDVAEMDYERFCGGGFNKNEFPLTNCILK